MTLFHILWQSGASQPITAHRKHEQGQPPLRIYLFFLIQVFLNSSQEETFNSFAFALNYHTSLIDVSFSIPQITFSQTAAPDWLFEAFHFYVNQEHNCSSCQGKQDGSVEKGVSASALYRQSSAECLNAMLMSTKWCGLRWKWGQLQQPTFSSHSWLWPIQQVEPRAEISISTLLVTAHHYYNYSLHKSS